MTSSTRHFTPTGSFRPILDTVPTAPENRPNNSRNIVQIKLERCPNRIGIASKITRNTQLIIRPFAFS